MSTEGAQDIWTALVRENTDDPQRQTGIVHVNVGDCIIFTVSCNTFFRSDADDVIIAETLITGLRSAGLIDDEGELRMNEFPLPVKYMPEAHMQRIGDQE